jgi:hypothetical protein
MSGHQSQLAEQIKLSIQTDLYRNTFDSSLDRYHSLKNVNTACMEFQKEQPQIPKQFDEYL